MLKIRDGTKLATKMVEIGDSNVAIYWPTWIASLIASHVLRTVTQKKRNHICTRQVDTSMKELKKIFQKNWHQGSAPWTCKKRLQVRFKYYNEPFSCFDQLIAIYI